jgi:hypothetical protein
MNSYHQDVELGRAAATRRQDARDELETTIVVGEETFVISYNGDVVGGDGLQTMWFVREKETGAMCGDLMLTAKRAFNVDHYQHREDLAKVLHEQLSRWTVLHRGHDDRLLGTQTQALETLVRLRDRVR